VSTERAEIVVIGAGVMGLSIATHLAKRGARPVVLERDRICTGTTGQSGGVVRQLYTNPRMAVLARDALDIFHNWNDHYLGDPGFVKCGVLFPLGPDTEERIGPKIDEQRSLGIKTDIISPAEAATLDPRFTYGDCSAVGYESTAGGADPVLTTFAFAETTRSLGVEIREGVAVNNIQSIGGRVTGVATNTGDIAADVVINAAGAWGIDLLAAHGHTLPIRFTRHPMALFRRAGALAGSHPIVLDIHTDAYFISRGDLTLVGKLGTMPADDGVDRDSYNRGVSNSEIARYQAAAANRMPGLETSALWGGWAGIYDESVDAHPIVDAVPGLDGAFCALGMSGNCFKLSPIIGRMLADRILDGPEAIGALDLFRFNRFADGTQHQPAIGALSVMG
jgi:sarcosine oxidase subunit beta